MIVKFNRVRKISFYLALVMMLQWVIPLGTSSEYVKADVPQNEALIQFGDFEAGDESVTVDQAEVNHFYSKLNNYEMVSSLDVLSGAYALKLGKDASLPEKIAYSKKDLKPDTKYRITFAAKVADTKSTLGFQISGYKNNDPADRNNVMNFIEHTQIKNGKWSTFYYDFETSEQATSAYIEFSTRAGSTAFVDDVLLIESGPVDPKPLEPELSRGSQLFIEKGLQFQAWTATDEAVELRKWMKYPSAEDVMDMGLTALQYNDAPNYNSVLHEQLPDLKWGVAFGPEARHLSSSYFDQETIAANDPNKTGSPTPEQVNNGFLTSEQLANVMNLVNFGFGDEENYSDTLIQILKDWFEVSKQHYPDVLVHHNQVGNTPPAQMGLISTFNEQMLRKYMRTAKPDFLSYDMYYWREARESQEVGGTVIPFYDDLNRYRKVASEGYDGTGSSPIPFGKYMQAWRTGPGAATPEKRGDGWYEMTESQMNLEAFANWTFGAKWLSIFRWLDDNPGYLFTDSRVDEDGNPVKYHIYDQFKEMIRQSKNLGEHLVRINSTDVVIVPGFHKDNGETVRNNRPAGNAEWSKSIDQAYIDTIEVVNTGSTNEGLQGDVFIGYFDPLPGIDTTQYFTSTAPKYFMLLNGLTSGEGLPAEAQRGSSSETRQEITLTFNLSKGIDPNKLKKVSRLTGEVVSVPLKPLGNDQYELTTLIGGGMGDLYFWELGDSNRESYVLEEDPNDFRLTGDPEYANTREIRDLNGQTVTIGWIKDTYSPIPQQYEHIDFAFTKDADGKLQMKNVDIGTYFSRDYELDLWNKRIERIQKESHVNIQFVPDMEWTKEELINRVMSVKSGHVDAELPDILIVPDEWTWSGLIQEDMILPASMFNEFNFDERKWNKAYKSMTTVNDKIYGMYAGPTIGGTGLFVNKTLLTSIGVSDDLMNLQQQNSWDFSKLKEIAATFKNNPQNEGKYLIADTDELFRQMLYSNEAAPGSLTIRKGKDLAQYLRNFITTAQLYSDWMKSGLIAIKPEGSSDDWYVEQFSKGNVLFMVRPYNKTVEQLKVSYKVQDATVEMQDGMYLGKPSKIPVIVDASESIIPDGEYAMPQDSWVFLMFPKGPAAKEYQSMLESPSYPVMLASATSPSDAAYVWNLLTEEYTGVAYTRFLKTYLNQRSADMNTLQRIGLKEGVWDALSGTGLWKEEMKASVMPRLQDGKVNPGLYSGINKLFRY